MRVAVPLQRDEAEGWDGAAAFAAEAERLGVHSVWTAEAWGFDAVTPLAFVAARTSRIGLGTGIMQVGARTPAMVAMTALTMRSLTGGRFILGLGASGPQVMEGWHGVPFDHPVQRTREAIEIVRRVLRGERLEYQGEVYRLPLPGGRGRVLRSAAPPGDVPIYVASLAPRSLEMTGELCDGWVGASFVPESAEVFLGPLRAGAERAGRTLDDLDLQVPVAVEFGDDVEAVARRHARGYAFTFGAMGSPTRNFYLDAFVRQGFGEAARAVQRLWLDGRREEAASRVPLELALKTNLLGTEGAVRDRLRAYRSAGITTLRATIRGETPAARMETMGRLVSLVREVDAEAGESRLAAP
ncbi:MAG TPA: LLM class flavin-dependent oxidoreductase [Candidatus Dormibacteraeota bacterium]|nr:LLM class flavin-dependent oxidoreductase [Candidatus Dormibacteraeota bacterium]